ncbi:MAG: ABC transporter ATP-binding protein [Desulfurococcales archaeon]|nr:ABC transporter ATP-binding protein [Desulfurococcales archaeon]
MACRVEGRRLEYRSGGRTILEVGEAVYGPGGLHMVIGPNGAGKTTLLRVLIGLAGRGDRSICSMDPGRARRLLSYIPAHIDADRWARVEEVLYAAIQSSRGSRESMEEASRLLGVDRLWGRRFGELSSGEQRLVMVAAGIARRPEVLIADEPLSFLDIRNQASVIRAFRRLSEGVTILMTTHELLYIGYADTVTLLQGGRVLYNGPPDSLGEDLLARVYGVKVQRTLMDDGRPAFIPIV